MTHMNVKHKDIATYWINRVDECDLAFDWSDALEVCWRCGCYRRLQRCHIVPRASGGSSEDPSNFVLLCARCHREGPNVASPDAMWHWLKAEAARMKKHRDIGGGCYDMYNIVNGILEFEKIYGRKADEHFLVLGFTKCEAHKTAMEKAVCHFGDGDFNAATHAAILHEVETAGRIWAWFFE